MDIPLHVSGPQTIKKTKFKSNSQTSRKLKAYGGPQAFGSQLARNFFGAGGSFVLRNCVTLHLSPCKRNLVCGRAYPKTIPQTTWLVGWRRTQRVLFRLANSSCLLQSFAVGCQALFSLFNIFLPPFHTEKRKMKAEGGRPKCQQGLGREGRGKRRAETAAKRMKKGEGGGIT